ncbi:hypothetical protein TELCIR_15941 [Teladorsagia circumcincta]|uniref:SXP/RAL-2 family protein Ani s 5-like cation-binding domain-containing protein n=1 Tax=Teladorsagia circumcincta TaxID=45464 RepID=A0A2G9TX29_TELCI|nr:hypothetical protein TELCIR_15941 [Teladorsagia circumcincta]
MNTTLFVLLAGCAVFYTVFAHPPPGCQRPPKPEFLDNANETVRKEFFDIVKNHGVPPEQKRAQVLEWAKRYGLEEQAKQHEDKVHEVMSKNVSANTAFVLF